MRIFLLLLSLLSIHLVRGDEIAEGPLSRAYVRLQGRGTYLVYQNFEYTNGVPVGTLGYDERDFETWTENGSPDEDYTADALEGNHSLHINPSAASHYVQVNFTGKSEAYGFMLFKMPTTLPGSSLESASFRNQAGATNVLRLRVTSGGLLNITHGGTANISTGAAMATNTMYRVWWYYKAATSPGATDGLYHCAFSTSIVKPINGDPNYRGASNGNGAALTDQLRLGNQTAATYDYIIDKVVVSESAIGQP